MLPRLCAAVKAIRRFFSFGFFKRISNPGLNCGLPSFNNEIIHSGLCAKMSAQKASPKTSKRVAGKTTPELQLAASKLFIGIDVDND